MGQVLRCVQYLIKGLKYTIFMLIQKKQMRIVLRDQQFSDFFTTNFIPIPFLNVI